jgi:hypothetical protein
VVLVLIYREPVNGLKLDKECVMKLNKLLFVTMLASVLAACSSTDPYEKRAEQERERQEKYVERSLSKAPDWMFKLPQSTAAVYANGTGVSQDMNMADEKAILMAFSKICMAAGGEVDKQSKMFLSDSERSTSERSEMAIRAMCKNTDISGVEVVETRRVSEGTRYRTYMLVSLPLGEANQLAERRDRKQRESKTDQRSREAFDELDGVIKKNKN